MITCERCGADAVDARGRCHNCGWQAPMNGYHPQGSSPSLGETRAAEIPGAPSGMTGRTSAVPGPGGSAIYGPTRSFGAGLPPVSATAGPTSRYCGTCGARLEPGRGFCGQCGAPVASTTGVYGAAAPSSGGARYQVGGEDEWSADDGNAPTEEIPELPPAYVNPYAQPMGRSPMSGPYGSMGYASGVGAPSLETPSGTSRTMRLVLGMFCLLGSVASAVAAIILALAQSPASGH